jgi:hypothetical protein
MSAVAHVADAQAVVPELHLAGATHQTVAEMQEKEMYRWLLWFGSPVLVMAIFMGATYATGGLWGIAGVLAALIADICILIWLCISSDTNATGAPEFAAAH